jgi:hypothetical protein
MERKMFVIIKESEQLEQEEELRYFEERKFVI